MQTPTAYATISNTANVVITHENEWSKELLTKDCLNYLATLHRLFNPRRLGLLRERIEKQIQLNNGLKYTFPLETETIRNDPFWKVAPVPKQLEKRWIEITGPASQKGCINAMNSGANVFMADCEDALAPTWQNIISAQKYLLETNKRTLKFTQKDKTYQFKTGELATLIVRPRGWHLSENHVLVDDQPMSGSIFDFAVYFYHNYKVRAANGFGGVYYYLPKLETYKEAQLWADVFAATEQYFAVPTSTIRATVLIETIGGAIDMEEIVYVLKNYLVGLNAGRWDYIFSCIKKSQGQRDVTFPDRGQVTMEVPFMRAYTNRLVQVCHKRGAHAIGGMAAFIPSQSDQKVNEMAFSKVTHDKQREVKDGFDGSWVAHPGLVKHAQEIFAKALSGKDHQKHVMRNDVKVTAEQLIDYRMPTGTVSEEGVANNIDVCIQYIYNWLLGVGAVGLHNLMEDAATAEIARGQIWQWIQNGTKTTNGNTITAQYYKKLRNTIVQQLATKLKNHQAFQQAVGLTDRLILGKDFLEFLTNPAYEMVCGNVKCPFAAAKCNTCPYAKL